MSDPFEKLDEVDKEARAISSVRHFMKKSDEYRRPFLDQAKKADVLYRCWEATAKSPIQRANLRLPFAYLIVEAEVPEIAAPFFKDPMPFSIRGRTSDDMGWENGLSDLLSIQLEAMRWRPKFISFLKGMAIKGTAVAKVPYKFRERVVTKRTQTIDPLLGMPMMQRSKERVVTYDGPELENLDLEDFFPDWTVTAPGDVENMRGCVHRTHKTLSELKGLARKKQPDGTTTGVYTNLSELEMSLSKRGCNAWSEPHYSGEYSSDPDQLKDSKKKPIEIWEYWGLFDERGDGAYQEYVLTIANGDVLIRCEENPYDYKCKPFVACVAVPQDGEFYGCSEVFAVSGLIKESQSLRNARLDQVNLAVNRMWVVERASGINSKALYSRPNGIVFTNDIRGIQPLPAPEVPASAFNEIQSLGSEIQQVAASTSGPNLSEAGRVFGRSATGAQLVSNIANSRASIKALMVSELFFKPLARRMMEINSQYVTEEQWVRVSDPNSPNPFSMLPLDAFHTDYDFEPVTSLQEDNQQRFQNMQLGMQFFQVAEQSQPGTINWEVVFEALGRDLLGRSYKKFTRTPEERQMLQMQQLAGEQAVNAQQGQAAPQPNANPFGDPNAA